MPATDGGILRECRRNHNSAQNSTLQGQAEATLSARERALFQQGKVFWAAVVKANAALYRPGNLNARGCVVFSFDPHYDDHFEDLANIRDTVSALRNKPSADPQLTDFAVIVSDDYSTISNQIVPAAMTRSREVRYEELYFLRPRLPTRYLADRRVPVIADPSRPSPIMLLPLHCWAEALVQQWKSLAQANPAAPASGARPVGLEEFAANPLSLSPAAASEIRKIVTIKKIKSYLLRVGAENGLFSLDLVQSAPDPQLDFSFLSEGIPVVINSACAENLMGIEVHFEQSPKLRGFKFKRKPSPPSASP